MAHPHLSRENLTHHPKPLWTEKTPNIWCSQRCTPGDARRQTWAEKVLGCSRICWDWSGGQICAHTQKRPMLCEDSLPNTQQILYILCDAHNGETHTPCCPVTLKFVLCPFLIGGLYFQYLPAHSGTEVWEAPVGGINTGKHHYACHWNLIEKNNSSSFR